jgi:hypothetical protein
MLDRRSIKVAALMLATAALAAPAATAKPIDTDDPALRALEARSLEMERQYSGRDLQTVPSDDRRYFRGADTTEQPAPAREFRGADTTEQPARYFRGADTTQQPGTNASPDIEIVRREAPGGDAWHWDDAAVGAGTTAALLLLLGASGAMVARRRGRPQVQS